MPKARPDDEDGRVTTVAGLERPPDAGQDGDAHGPSEADQDRRQDE